MLAPALERSDVDRWACGRPTGREVARAASNDAAASFMEVHTVAFSHISMGVNTCLKVSLSRGSSYVRSAICRAWRLCQAHMMADR